MSKGSQRRPENRAMIERNWPFIERKLRQRREREQQAEQRPELTHGHFFEECQVNQRPPQDAE